MSQVRTLQRAEHGSIDDFLRVNLTESERAHIGFFSFNQWPWTTAAVVESALGAHAIGSEITIASWADHTPLHDPGWTTSRRIAALLGSAPIDTSVRRILIQAGVPADAFAAPPLKHWKPSGLPPLPEPLTRSAIRQLTYAGSGMGRSILQVHPDFNTPIRNDYVWPKRWIRAAMRSYAWVFDQTRALIEARNLTTIVVFNGRFTHDRAAAAASESLGVKVLYYDYGGIETSFDLTHTTTHNWDALQKRMQRMWETWGDDRDEIAHHWFRNREARIEPGMDVFLGLQSNDFLPKLPRAERLIVFFSSSGDEIAELDLDWRRYFGSQEAALQALADVCARNPDVALVVRTHPHMRLKPEDDRQRWIAAVERIGVDLHIGPDSPADSYALMRAADRVITYGSTTGIESAYRGRPTAVMGPSAYQLLGCVTPVTSVDELNVWLADPPQPNPVAALPYGLMMQRRGFSMRRLQPAHPSGFAYQGIELAEASELSRKVSHFLGTTRTRWLTRR